MGTTTKQHRQQQKDPHLFKGRAGLSYRKFHGTVLIDQQISALQVPMNNLVAVEIFQPLEHLPQVLAEHIDLQAAAESFHDLRD